MAAEFIGPALPEGWRAREAEEDASPPCSSSDESSDYDPAEERRMAYLINKQERARLNRERRETLRDLRAYQWFQSAWNDGEAQLEAAKVRIQAEEEVSWADELRSNIKWKQAEAAAEKLLEAMSRAELYGSDDAAELWSAHEIAWKAFERGDHADLGYDDIPWPPVTTGLLSAMAAAELSSARADPSRGAAEAEGRGATSREAFVAHKRAFKKAHLRWHPDKFLHKFGRALGPGASERVEERVREISQAINESWSKIKES